VNQFYRRKPRTNIWPQEQWCGLGQTLRQTRKSQAFVCVCVYVRACVRCYHCYFSLFPPFVMCCVHLAVLGTEMAVLHRAHKSGSEPAASCISYCTAWNCCRSRPLRPPSLASCVSRHPPSPFKQGRTRYCWKCCATLTAWPISTSSSMRSSCQA
jgi:hypothetical protein